MPIKISYKVHLCLSNSISANKLLYKINTWAQKSCAFIYRENGKWFSFIIFQINNVFGQTYVYRITEDEASCIDNA